MTDKQPITEDDIEEYENYDSKLVKLVIYTNDRGLKKQILDGLKALEELPKLKEKAKEWDLMDKVSKSFGIVSIFQFGMEIDRMGQENQKLKEDLEQCSSFYTDLSKQWKEEI